MPINLKCAKYIYINENRNLRRLQIGGEGGAQRRSGVKAGMRVAYGGVEDGANKPARK